MNVTGLWDQLVDAVCRPPRDDAYSDVDLVGGRRAAFRWVLLPFGHGAAACLPACLPAWRAPNGLQLRHLVFVAAGCMIAATTAKM
jgi:hypothetical protein